MRTRVAPLLLPRAIALEPIREYLFRTVSQITLNYRGLAAECRRGGGRARR